MMRNTILLHANFHWSAYHVLAALKFSRFVVQCSISSVKILMINVTDLQRKIWNIWYPFGSQLWSDLYYFNDQIGRLEMIIIQNYIQSLIFFVNCSKFHTLTPAAKPLAPHCSKVPISLRRALHLTVMGTPILLSEYW